jgi:CheY-like chemotaxis protein
MVSLKGLRILFADDETYSMRPTIEALENAGAQVDLVTDGTEVLEYMRQHKDDPYDVLILDIMMPGGTEVPTPDGGRSTGVEVYRRMQKEKIKIPPVVSTTVTDNSILDVFLRDEKIPVIQKPYRFEELERQIQKVLAERERR